ncbi:MAG TPA: hypothetical protein PKM59_07275 [Thermodesulfobacteriota bacterium]|nr:hypothetical protein [Thermodesulfobacteriota bacterium]HNU70375.1 hypothetical protein [Thermodesulfobacteriota bacterium]
MSSIREKVARFIAPNLKNDEELRTIVKEEVERARMEMPINLDYDPQGDGYRRLTNDGQMRRDLSPMSQDTMIELAYYMYDSSGLTKRFARDTKNFVLGEGVSFTVKNDTKTGDAQTVLERFWNHSMNQLDLRLRNRIEFLGLLGEQCWPVSVNRLNGMVFLSYVDPSNIQDVTLYRNYPEVIEFVRLRGTAGQAGPTLRAIREELDPRKREYGRLTGECFFFAINHPPNSPRGRSDFISQFDYINAMEESTFDELDRIKLMKSFIWDVMLKGASNEDITEFLRTNTAPKPGSVRAHNESVEWKAVSPDLKLYESKAFFDYMRSYISACQNRPTSWLGEGGKAYQTEADLMGEPTFKDLGERQLYVKNMIEFVLRFVLDQAILYGGLREGEEPFEINVNMPEMQTKDLVKLVTALFTLSQSLMIAQSSGWISQETATELYATVAERIGFEIDAAAEIDKAAKTRVADGLTKDYAAREAMILDIVERIRKKDSGAKR